jgi:ribosome-binding ATPase YchF (GTP1/OBG family)
LLTTKQIKEGVVIFKRDNLFFLSGTFEDKEITHVEGEVDPIRDLEIINEELRLKVGFLFHMV